MRPTVGDAPASLEQPMGLENLDLSGLEPVEVTKVITVTVEGIVEPSDLGLLLEAKAANGPTGVEAGDLKRIREKHHAVARYVANGVPQGLIATLCNYTEAYLSTLLNNPAMQELIAYYRAAHVNAAEVIGERLRSAGMGAVEKLIDRMSEDELDNNELLSLAKLGLDRSGHGPSSTQHRVNENHTIDHAELQRLNNRAREDSRADIIELTPEPKPVLPVGSENETQADEEGLSS